jgi:hypothetical protein
MAHFAEIDSNNIVINVFVTEDTCTQEICQSIFNSQNRFIQTSYNTSGGSHATGGTPLRKNYACVGYTYDDQRDAFIRPAPFKSWTSWVLNETTCQYDPPIPQPDPLPMGTINKSIHWNESAQNWAIVDDPSPNNVPAGQVPVFDMEHCLWVMQNIAV